MQHSVYHTVILPDWIWSQSGKFSEIKPPLQGKLVWTLLNYNKENGVFTHLSRYVFVYCMSDKGRE